MTTGKINYFEKIEKSSHQEYINSHNHCILCGGVLELRHIRILENEEIKEEASCPSCEIRTRDKTFPMQ